MQSERDLVNELRAFLIQDRGYPPDSIVEEPWFGKPGQPALARADLGVLDPDVGEVAAVFEVKGSSPPQSHESARSTLQAWEDRASGVIPYLAIPSSAGLRFWRLKEGKLVELPQSGLPAHSALLAMAESARRIRARVERAETIDRFRLACYCLAGLVFAFFLLSVLGIVTLTAQSLALLLLAVGLVVLPNAAKLKLLGVEFERYESAAKREERRH